MNVDTNHIIKDKSVIKAIRDCSFIKKLVYISCDHTNGLLHNGSA